MDVKIPSDLRRLNAQIKEGALSVTRTLGSQNFLISHLKKEYVLIGVQLADIFN